jgi:hypothetical protein
MASSETITAGKDYENLKTSQRVCANKTRCTCQNYDDVYVCVYMFLGPMCLRTYVYICICTCMYVYTYFIH